MRLRHWVTIGRLVRSSWARALLRLKIVHRFFFLSATMANADAPSRAALYGISSCMGGVALVPYTIFIMAMMFL
jgi:hypothetical protein